jgi:hypothetical protein
MGILDVSFWALLSRQGWGRTASARLGRLGDLTPQARYVGERDECFARSDMGAVFWETGPHDIYESTGGRLIIRDEEEIIDISK